MNQKGIMSFMVALVLVLLALILTWSVFLPMLQQIQVSTFSAQQKILQDTNSAIQSLPEGSSKDALNVSLNAELNTTTTQFDIISFFMQYWWVFVVLIVSFGTYLLSRTTVQIQSGF